MDDLPNEASYGENHMRKEVPKLRSEGRSFNKPPALRSESRSFNKPPPLRSEDRSFNKLPPLRHPPTQRQPLSAIRAAATQDDNRKDGYADILRHLLDYLEQRISTTTSGMASSTPWLEGAPLKIKK
ncbi:hypothetical protein WJX72_006278 [[Myrmecia] bisecta]|uniref:Uncharacterized protein n=1 Tax=[Myrmecia] bisecta TaxID=41462 RepID=A0AAW1QR23_9CHLO